MSRAARLSLLFSCLAAVAPGSAPTEAQLTALGAKVLTECTAPGDCGAEDQFGSSLAVGDFDDDGFADLAVGVPGETVGADAGAGSVHVYYGSPGGLTSAGEQLFDQDSPGITTTAEPADRFGGALAAGDFDRDGFDDLAIGSDGEGLSGFVNVGAVEVLFGSPAGLAVAGYRFLSQESLPPGADETNEEDDRFGFALAAGPLGKLAIGVPFETGLGGGSSGIAHELTTSAPGQPLDAGTTRESADAAACDAEFPGFRDWGFSVLYGRFGNLTSLVVAAPQTQVTSEVGGSGRLAVFTSAEIECFDQDTPGILGTPGAGDRFGHALAKGDFNDDEFDDLVVGVPFEDIAGSGDTEAGVVQIIYGSSIGLTSTANQLFDQDDFSDEEAQDGDHFGLALGAGDFDGDGHDDLAIGAPEENFQTVADSGAVNVLYGANFGLSILGNQTFNSDFPPAMPDSPDSFDFFGHALAVGDFDDNGIDDLAIGVPGEDLGAAGSAGMVTVLYGLDRATGAFGTVQFDDNADTVSESADVELYQVSRVGGAVTTASVEHSRSGGTATPGVDFTYTSGTESWTAGNLSPNVFSIRVLEDTLDEPNETIVFTLSNPSTGTAIGSPSNFTVTIVDNDVAGGVEFDSPFSVFAETAGTVQVEVVRTGGAASGVTVAYATEDDSAIAGEDYVATSGTLTWDEGETVQTIEVELIDDGENEGNEVLRIGLSSPGGGAVLGSTTTHQLVILGNAIFVDGFESGSPSAWDAIAP